MTRNIFLIMTVLSVAGSAETRLLRQPTLSRDKIAFICAGDIWTAARGGGPAQRLTATEAAESMPRFSPDGKWIAFTREGDVYVIPSGGGPERRLTWHPGQDLAVNWTPDGRKVLVQSSRTRGNLTASPHLYLIPAEGGYAEELPIPRAGMASFSPDGRKIAYSPNYELVLWFLWKRYRGGSLGYVAMYDLESHRYDELPRLEANDVWSMWHKESIYFASDRDAKKVMNLYRYDLPTRKTYQLTESAEWDVRHPSLGPDAIVYEKAGLLYSVDLDKHSVSQIHVVIPDDVKASEAQHSQWLRTYREAWQLYKNRAFHPNPNWDSIKPRYEALLQFAAHESDAEYVTREMLSETSQSHVDLVKDAKTPPSAGLPGADFTAANGFYRFTKIYRGKEQDEKARGPLAGLDVKEGDYLVAVDGKKITPSVEVYSAFAGLAGKEAKLTVNSAPAETGSREITVKLIANEQPLRYFDWARTNHARVTEATGGRVGYVHVVNVEGDGIEQFKKDWRSQRNKVQAMVVDARNNMGGGGADEVMAYIMRRPTRLMYDNKRRVPIWDYFIDGPKVMITNELAVSGGDELPYEFQRMKAGPLVGARTFGAMIGSIAPEKISGGYSVRVPAYGFYWMDNPKGWAPEGYGAMPDHIVEWRPYALTGGRDPQLEMSIELALEGLKTYKTMPDPPPYEPLW